MEKAKKNLAQPGATQTLTLVTTGGVAVGVALVMAILVGISLSPSLS